jgi:hypothetical protein
VKGIFEDFNFRMGRLENEKAKNNLGSGELRLTRIKPADFGERIFTDLKTKSSIKRFDFLRKPVP